MQRCALLVAGLATALCSIAVSAIAYETTMQPVLTTITTTEAVGLLQAMSSDGIAFVGLDTSDPEHPTIEIRFASGRHAWITLYNKARYISYDSSGRLIGERIEFGCMICQTGFSVDTKPSTTAINEWNRTKLFGRAYRDSVLDPMLDAWFYLDGGVTVDAIEAFVKRCQTAVDSFYAAFAQGK